MLRSKTSLFVCACLLPLGCSGSPSSTSGSNEARSKPVPEVDSTKPTDVVSQSNTAACDVERLRKTAQTISDQRATWKPELGVLPDHFDAAASAIWIACGDALPPELARLIDFVAHAASEMHPSAEDSDGLDSLLPGHARTHDPNSWHDPAALEPVCPGAAALLTDKVPSMPGSERAAALFDGCKLAQQPDLPFSRELFIAANPSHLGLRVYMLDRWLRERGLAEPDAHRLVREIMTRLTIDNSVVGAVPASLRLPVAPTGRIIDHAVVIQIGKDEISFGDKTMVGLRSGELPDHEASGAPIGALFDALVEEHDKLEQLKAHGNPAVDPEVLLVADRDIPWSTLRLVLESVQRAQFERSSVAVLVADPSQPLRSVVVHDAAHPMSTLELSATDTVQQLVDRVAEPS